MGARTKARKRALDVLFAAEMRGEDAVAALDAATAAGEAPNNPYTTTLVRGVAEHREEIDATLTAHAQGWTLARMPAVDRNVLRLAVWEILHAEDVDSAVAISEALTLVGDLSTDDSPGFVNGVLSAVARDQRSAG
ncbi:transcription antitermination factor NusB [Nocardioides zeae]|uniref:Transcription antitermination protein NusB n=1 Tax=Nocardioides imazamoxiresistens TaxID=3231893 RepID=A0ABU3PZC6_9ACTN|nr:transcription antitermination factor NusB [Nocardioides zeae]MDT9594623.1 transcription antitermination factor NusB [Nocardioides zeae]